MFTGLIEEVGRLRSARPEGGGAVLTVEARRVLHGTAQGDSIAVNGCCLTVTDLGDGTFTAHAGAETLARTTVAAWRPGRPLNLERALSPASRLGGHFVQGHVDGVGQFLAAAAQGETTRLRFSLPAESAPFVVEKGSIAVDGISLTVTVVDGGAFEVAAIPHTMLHTTLGTLHPGQDVNLEADILAKYVHRAVAAMRGETGAVTEDYLREHGFC